MNQRTSTRASCASPGAERRLARATGAALLCLCCFSAGPAFARGKDGYKQKVQQAETLYQAGSYDQALDAFTAAFEKKPSATVLFNIAQCHRQAGRDREALATYQRVLTEFKKSPVRAEAEVQVAAAKARLGAREAAEKQEAERKALEAERQRLAAEREALAAAQRKLAEDQAKAADTKARAEADAQARAKGDAQPAALPAAALAVATKADPPTPIYKRGWFWGAVGGVAAVALGVGLGVGLGRGGGATTSTTPMTPTTDLGGFAISDPSLGRFPLK